MTPDIDTDHNHTLDPEGEICSECGLFDEFFDVITDCPAKDDDEDGEDEDVDGEDEDVDGEDEDVEDPEIDIEEKRLP